MTAKHYPIRTEESGIEPDTVKVYVCPCGYRSTDAKQFVSVNNPSMQGVTCEGALEWLFSGAVAEVEGEK